MPAVWSGVDGGRTHHHCVVMDSEGQRLLSRRVANDEAVLLELIGDVVVLADGGPVTWAVDLNAGGATLLIALLAAHDQRLLYIPGRMVHNASGQYRGGGKSDTKDAYVITDQARMRRGLQPVRFGDEINADLRTLVTHRADVWADRTRAVNRLRAQILEYFPALERAFDYGARQSALILLTGAPTPASLRAQGQDTLTAWLRERGARRAAVVAAKAIAAAHAQHTTVPGEKTAAAMATRLAKAVMALDEELAELDTLIQGRFREHPYAELILSMPGFGVTLSAEFLAHTGGDMNAFGSPDRLAGVTGLAPVPHDSDSVSGNLKRPKRYHRRLLRARYLAAMSAIPCDPASKRYYQRKPAEGKRHVQAVLALARPRLNMLWTMLRNRTPYQAFQPATS